MGVKDIDISLLDEYFIVDSTSASGLRWKRGYRGNKEGDKAGNLLGSKYSGKRWRLKFHGKEYLLHRVVWVLSGNTLNRCDFLDHVDGDCLNNSISNLRIASNRENQQNQKKHRCGHLPGAHFRKRSGKWTAKITLRGKSFHLGYYNNPEEAHKTYISCYLYIKENPKCTIEDLRLFVIDFTSNGVRWYRPPC